MGICPSHSFRFRPIAGIGGNGHNAIMKLFLALGFLFCPAFVATACARDLTTAVIPSHVLRKSSQYEGKHLKVTGVLRLPAAWWEASIRDSKTAPRTDDLLTASQLQQLIERSANSCLNLHSIEFLQRNRKALDGRKVTLSGVFENTGWDGALTGCGHSAGLNVEESSVATAICSQFPDLRLDGCSKR